MLKYYHENPAQPTTMSLAIKNNLAPLKINRNQRYIALGLLVLVLLAAMFIIKPEMLLLVSDDISYHLLTAQGFVRNGGLTLAENWASLPMGRPHLYPPLFHLLLSIPVALGISPFLILKLTTLMATIGLIILSWWGLGKLFNFRLAFIYLLLLTLDATLINMVAITTPASMVLLASPLLLLLIKNQRVAAAIILLTLFWYSHMIFPYLIVAALIFWVIFNRHYLLTLVKVVLTSFLLYLPWLIHILINQNYFLYTQPHWLETTKKMIVWEINLTLAILFIIALLVVVARSNRDREKFKNWLFLAGLILVSSPIILFLPLRFFSSVGGWAMVVTIAYFLEQLLITNFGQTRPRANQLKNSLIFLGLILLISGHYRVAVDWNQKSLNYYSDKNIFYQGLKIMTTGEGYPGMFLYYDFSPENFALAAKINQAMPPEEILLSLAPFFGVQEFLPQTQHLIPQLFASLANRPMANSRRPENQWQKNLPLTQAKIVLADYRQTNLFTGPKENPQLAQVLEEQFTVLGESGRLVVFKNNNPNTFKTPPLKPILPLGAAWLLIGLMIGFVGFSSQKLKA